MNKEKQIEEMAKEIDKTFTYAKMYYPDKYEPFELDVYPDEIARHLVNQNYRKINENEVVLTREDMSKYAEDCIAGQETGLDIINALIARAERYKKQAKELEKQRDEQAYITEDLIQEKHLWTKQIAEKIIHYIDTEIRNYINDSDFNLFNNDIKWLKEKYGVEIEE